MQLTLNELSYAEATSESQAGSWYDCFFKTCLKIETDLKVKVSIVYSKSPKEVVFNSSLPFTKWLYLQEKDNRSSILSMLTSAQIIHEYPYYVINNLEGKGIAYAFENDSLLISFISDSTWKKCWLTIIQQQLNELVEMQEEELPLRNCYDPDLVKCHYPFMISRTVQINRDIVTEIRTGQDLWTKKDAIFPNLVVCESVKASLIALTIENDILKNTLKKFVEFQQYFAGWVTGDFNKDALTGNIRLESESRERDYEKQLLIECPDKTTQFFSLHCDIGVWGYRMHFYPDPTLRKCIIGYIGKKIGT